jgi:hypothetical protein
VSGWYGGPDCAPSGPAGVRRRRSSPAARVGSPTVPRTAEPAGRYRRGGRGVSPSCEQKAFVSCSRRQAPRREGGPLAPEEVARVAERGKVRHAQPEQCEEGAVVLERSAVEQPRPRRLAQRDLQPPVSVSCQPLASLIFSRDCAAPPARRQLWRWWRLGQTRRLGNAGESREHEAGDSRPARTARRQRTAALRPPPPRVHSGRARRARPGASRSGGGPRGNTKPRYPGRLAGSWGPGRCLVGASRGCKAGTSLSFARSAGA